MKVAEVIYPQFNLTSDLFWATLIAPSKLLFDPKLPVIDLLLTIKFPTLEMIIQLIFRTDLSNLQLRGGSENPKWGSQLPLFYTIFNVIITSAFITSHLFSIGVAALWNSFPWKRLSLEKVLSSKGVLYRLRWPFFLASKFYYFSSSFLNAHSQTAWLLDLESHWRIRTSTTHYFQWS